MIKVLYYYGSLETDITNYVQEGSIQITRQINLPTQLQFTITSFGAQFVPPVLRGGISIVCTKRNHTLFTGYVSVQPQYSLLGTATQGLQAQDFNTGLWSRRQIHAMQITCASDEYILNLKAVPFIPAYINRTQGQILRDLANTLCPGFYDTTRIQDGDLVPYYAYDPSKNWSQIAKDFGDPIRYRYECKDKAIFYGPYGDGLLGITYDENGPQQTFDPYQLKTTPFATQIVNDVTVVGDTEAGNNHEDFFIGDGFTGNFPLRHKVFRGSSSLLLQESWQQNDLNTQQWDLEDPIGNFDFSAGALNIVGNTVAVLGSSFLSVKNGIELAGGINLQVGEVTVDDYSLGVLGGLYTDSSFDANSLLGGFLLTATGTIVTSASGAEGVLIYPWWDGAPVANPISTVPNHTYVLMMTLNAPVYSRYNVIRRTVDGEQYGGISTDTFGSVTFAIQDYNISQATGYFYTPTVTQISVTGVGFPDFALWVLANNQQLNVTIDNTTIATMPLGGLFATIGACGLPFPTGLALPMLPPGSGDFPGNAIPPATGYNMAVNYPDPVQSTGWHQLTLGNGFQLSAGQITSGNSADVLAFYADSIPTAGTQVRFQSYEAQTAVARLLDGRSINTEAQIVGDDGHRSAIVSNMNPLPHTSEDCENAGVAYLADSINVSYNGTYTCTELFFLQDDRDFSYWPTPGRFLHIHSPVRGIVQQKYLVTQVTISVLSMAEERFQFQLTFGYDTSLQKLQSIFTDLVPASILTPSDTASTPDPRDVQVYTSNILADLSGISFTYVDDTFVRMQVTDAYSGLIEVRKADTGWGRGAATSSFIGYVEGPAIELTRNNYDQTWYMRPTDKSMTLTSRRSKVMRVAYPRRPAVPTVINYDSNSIQYDFNGDQRNIYLIEVVAQQATLHGLVDRILLMRPVASYQDLLVQLSQFIVSYVPFTREFNARFFNLAWQAGPVFNLFIPQFPAPVITIGSLVGNVLVVNLSVDPRTDCIKQVVTISGSNDPGVFALNILQSITASQTSTTTLSPVPTGGTFYIFAVRYDNLGIGIYSNIITVNRG